MNRMRVYGLIANLVANAVLLYGLVGFIGDGTRLPLVLLAGAVTLGCIVLLSIPTRTTD